MKYVLIALAVIIGGIIWSNTLPDTKTPAPVTSETPTQTEPVTTLRIEDAPADSQKTPTGNDVGMEYPETEMSVPVPSATDARVYEISGKNFEFDVKEIRVKKNDTVTINFTSTDGFHDFVIDAFDAQTERVKTGITTSVTFVADKTGAFEYYCSVGSHRVSGMTGKIIVE